MISPQRKRLLVEGDDDLYAIVNLVAKHTPWPASKDQAPVRIEVCGSVSKILQKHFIAVTLGIVLDADDKAQGRWHAIRKLAQDLFPTIPAELPNDGLCIENAEGKRLGVWIMPDNKSHGMIETFMAYLVPSHEDEIWLQAKGAVNHALQKGAACRPIHIDKANIYTWLAWQDPPGQSLGRALMQNIFNHEAVIALSFVRWFKRLFSLSDLPPAQA